MSDKKPQKPTTGGSSKYTEGPSSSSGPPPSTSTIPSSTFTRADALALWNDHSDVEFRALLVRRYWEVDPRGRPSEDVVLSRIVTIVNLLGRRNLVPRDAVRLLANAGWNPSLAVQQFIETRLRQQAQAIQEAPIALPGTREGKGKEVQPEDDDDDAQPIPEGVRVIEVDHPDKPNRKAKAVFHHEIRRYLIERDLRRYGNYRYGRNKGTVFEDQTAPHPDQLRWGFDKRKHMPPANYQWSHMWWRGHIVVDIDRNALRDFRHLPSTLSSNVEGGLLEALERLDSRVRHQELSARQFSKKVLEHPTYDELKARDNKLSQQMRRFRERHGAITWNNPRSGSDAYHSWMEEHLPPHLKAMNTTRGFGGLSQREVTEIKSANIGKYGSRSRSQDPGKRAKYLADNAQKLRRLKELGDKVTATRSQRQESPATDMSSESEEIYVGEDARDLAPLNAEEELDLHDAMLGSILEFIRLTGNLPEIKSWNNRYFSLLWHCDRQLQKELHNPSPRVHLPGLGFWTGGIGNWRTAMREAQPLAKAEAEIERKDRALTALEVEEEEEDEDVEMGEDDDEGPAKQGDESEEEDDDDGDDEDEAERSRAASDA
ncbi:MAG: hypothetical protein Q9166_005660 [cf. Caloplaca sp. 2 TL-2023]